MNLEYYLLKNREILLFGEIDEKKAKGFILRARYIHSRSPKNQPLLIFINSGGGDVDFAISIIEEIKSISRDREVYTIGTGQVMSAAIFILAAGSKRYGCEYTSYMMHPFSYEPHTESVIHEQFKEQVLHTDKVYNNLITDLAITCGKKEPKQIKKFREDIQKNIWLDTDGALEFGLINSIWPILEKQT